MITMVNPFFLSKPTFMTIHWKALEEHFLMVPLLVFRFNFQGEMHFLNFFLTNNLSPPKEFTIWSQGSRGTPKTLESILGTT
jgi:hypothetical protein